MQVSDLDQGILLVLLFQLNVPVFFDHDRLSKLILIKLTSTFVFKSGSGSTRCYCGYSLKFPTKTSTKCLVPCSGDSTQYCGDSTGQYFNVYQYQGKIFSVLMFN